MNIAQNWTVYTFALVFQFILFSVYFNSLKPASHHQETGR